MRRARRSHPNRDLSHWSAGLSLFGTIAVIPLVVESLWLGGLAMGRSALVARMARAVAGLPNWHGTASAARQLAGAAVSLGPAQALVLAVPASLYGEGLRRAFRQIAPGRPERFDGWRGRAALLPVVAVAPFIALAVVLTAPWLAPRYAAGGRAALLAVIVGFTPPLTQRSVAAHNSGSAPLASRCVTRARRLTSHGWWGRNLRSGGPCANRPVAQPLRSSRLRTSPVDQTGRPRIIGLRACTGLVPWAPHEPFCLRGLGPDANASAMPAAEE